MAEIAVEGVGPHQITQFVEILGQVADFVTNKFEAPSDQSSQETAFLLQTALCVVAGIVLGRNIASGAFPDSGLADIVESATHNMLHGAMAGHRAMTDPPGGIWQ